MSHTCLGDEDVLFGHKTHHGTTGAAKTPRAAMFCIGILRLAVHASAKLVVAFVTSSSSSSSTGNLGYAHHTHSTRGILRVAQPCAATKDPCDGPFAPYQDTRVGSLRASQPVFGDSRHCLVGGGCGTMRALSDLCFIRLLFLQLLR